MTIRPSKFSKETQNALKIFDAETLFLDYTINDTVKYISINLWIYKDGEWKANGSISDSITNIDQFNRIALRFKETDVEVFTIDKPGDFIKYGFNEGCMGLKNSKSIVSNRITEPVNIVLNEEIPMWVTRDTGKNSIQSDSSSGFRNLECSDGVALTVTFSDKEIEQ